MLKSILSQRICGPCPDGVECQVEGCIVEACAEEHCCSSQDNSDSATCAQDLPAYKNDFTVVPFVVPNLNLLSNNCGVDLLSSAVNGKTICCQAVPIPDETQVSEDAILFLSIATESPNQILIEGDGSVHLQARASGDLVAKQINHAAVNGDTYEFALRCSTSISVASDSDGDGDGEDKRSRVLLNHVNSVNVDVTVLPSQSIDTVLSWGSGATNDLVLTAPVDQLTQQSKVRNVTLTCHLLSRLKHSTQSSTLSWNDDDSEILTSTLIQLPLYNAIYPIPSSVRIGYPRKAAETGVVWGHLFQTSSDDLDNNQFGVWTSGTVSLQLFSFSTVFVQGMTAYIELVSSQTETTTVEPHQFVELEVSEVTIDTVEDIGKSVIVSLPSFDLACSSSNNDKVINECSFALTLINKPSPVFGRGGTFQCPSNQNSKLCFDGSGDGNNNNNNNDMTIQSSRSENVNWVIKYVAGCTDPIYLPPGHLNCSLQATSQTCAFGSRDDCIFCPKGASCPGGYHAWSFPGYYTLSSQKGLVEKCATPSFERCIGWSTTYEKSMCGGEDVVSNSSLPNAITTSTSNTSNTSNTSSSSSFCYTGVLCAHCCIGYFATPDESCMRCPLPGNTYDALLDAALPFFGVLFGILLAMMGITCCLESIKQQRQQQTQEQDRESEISVLEQSATDVIGITLRQTKEFGLWSLLSAQVMASATSAPSTNLPRWIKQMYATVAFFNLDTSYVVHPECMETMFGKKDPFSTSRFMLAGMLCLTMLQLITFVSAACIRWGGKHKRTNQKHRSLAANSVASEDAKEEGDDNDDADADDDADDDDEEWSRHFDQNTGYWYLQNYETGETKWEEIVAATTSSIENPLQLQQQQNSNSQTHIQTQPDMPETRPPTSLRAMILSYMARINDMLFVIMSFGFPVISKYVLSLLHCIPEGIPEGIQEDSVMVLKSASLRTVCWEDEHVSLGLLALCTALIYMLGYPCLTFLYLRRVVLKNKTKSTLRLQRWDHFVGDDYKPEYYFFRHIYWALQFSMLAIYEYSHRGYFRCTAIIIVLLIYLILLCRYRPFSRLDRWKLYVRIPLVLLSIFIAILDVVKYTEDSNDVEHYQWSTFFAYLVFINCIVLLLLLPCTFFLINYGDVMQCCSIKYSNSNSNTMMHEQNTLNENEMNNKKELEMTSQQQEQHQQQDTMKEDTYIGDTAIRDDDDDDDDDGSGGGVLWVRHLDVNSGYWYVRHKRTGEVKWEENTTIKVKTEEVKKTKKTRLWSLAKKAKKKEVGGWVEVLDGADAKTVYVNLSTGEVRHTKPKAWVREMVKKFGNE